MDAILCLTIYSLDKTVLSMKLYLSNNNIYILLSLIIQATRISGDMEW